MTLKLRAEVAAADTWNLQSLYSSLEDWRKDFQSIENQIPSISTFRGKLGESAETLHQAVSSYLTMSRLLEKIYTFAHLQSDQDTANSENLGLLDQATNLYSRIGEQWSFLSPELLSLPDKTIQAHLSNSVLKPYKRMIEEIVRYKPHTLTQAEEQLLAAAGEVFGSCEKIFSQLNNADLSFGSIETDGQVKPLTHGSYTVFLKSRHRDIRKKAFEQYYGVFDHHKNTIATTLSGSNKRDIYLAKVRKFPSAREKSLFADNVPVSVYDNLISSVANNLKPLHRYYEIRKQALGLEDLRIFDTYVPLVPDISVQHSYEEACQRVIESLAPLGKEYCQVLEAGLQSERWVDRFENKGKRSGAYSSGCYDSVPYILMNYKSDNLNDVFTLTHEAGHSMHSYYSIKNQPYQDHGYTIFVAEVASTFNEQLLLRHLKQVYANDKRMLAYLINHQIDDIKATLYRQTMFAEFEKLTHERLERHEPLTIDVLREIYGTLLRKYFGDTVTVDKLDELECLRIPHFYSAFYVYKYATGLSAAIALSQLVVNGTEKDRERYLGFLKSGGSKYPLELLRDAGVDMTEPAPVDSALRLFGSLVEELDSVLKQI